MGLYMRRNEGGNDRAPRYLSWGRRAVEDCGRGGGGSVSTLGSKHAKKQPS